MSFVKINPEDLVISADSITGTVWSGNNPTLTTFFTSSTQENSNVYFLEVYDQATTISGSEVQFCLEYGHLYGSGSSYYNSLIPGMSPTRTIYGQFRTLVNADENTNFNFGTNNTNSKDIYIISVNRARYKESLFPASLNLYLRSGSGTIHLTDNSRDVSTITYTDAGRVFDIVSGSNGNAVSTAYFSNISAGYTPSGSYGKFLPDVGLIILNPRALALPFASGGIGLPINESSNAPGLNNRTLYSAILSGSSGFQLNSQETITSDYVFVRVKNGEFNYTTNPSIISASGALIYSNLINNPQTYITTVGLYNDNSDLLAVAKLSKPLPKDFTKEALIRMKLDF